MKKSNLMKRVFAATLAASLIFSGGYANIPGLSKSDVSVVEAASENASLSMVCQGFYNGSAYTDPDTGKIIVPEETVSDPSKECNYSEESLDYKQGDTAFVFFDAGTTLKYKFQGDEDFDYCAINLAKDASGNAIGDSISSKGEGQLVGNGISVTVSDGFVYFSSANEEFVGSNYFVFTYHGKDESVLTGFIVKVETLKKAEGVSASSDADHVVGTRSIGVSASSKTPGATDGYDWTSSNTSIATISKIGKGLNGTLESQDPPEGTNVTITATSNSGIDYSKPGKKIVAIRERGEKASKTIFISKRVKATAVSFKKKSYKVAKGNTLQLRNEFDYEPKEGVNDNWVFTSDTPSVASVVEDTGVVVANSVGKSTITLKPEDGNAISDTATITVYVQTKDLVLKDKNDNELKSYSMRAGNEIEVWVHEDADATEHLVPQVVSKTSGVTVDDVIEKDSETGNYYTFINEKQDEVSNIKKYIFKAKKEISKKTELTVTFSTDRKGDPTLDDQNDIKSSLSLDIYPAIKTSENKMKFKIGQDEVSSLELYRGETKTLTVDPGDAENVADKIIWEYVGTNDGYVEDNSATAYDSHTIDINAVRKPASGYVTLKASMTSNPEVYKTIQINIKQLAEGIYIKSDAVRPTVNVDETIDLKGILTPENSDESIEWVTEDGTAALFVTSDGEKGKTSGNTVKVIGKKKGPVNIYATTSKSKIKSAPITINVIKAEGVSIRTANEVTAPDIGSVEGVIGTNRTVFAIVTDADGKQQNDAVFTWNIANKNVADFVGSPANSAEIAFKKVGSTTITVESGGITKEYELICTSPMYNEKISINDVEDSYVYLPNGKKPEIKPTVVANGIDSRATAEDGKYTLKKNTDYSESDDYPSDGKCIINYPYTISIDEVSGGLYTGKNVSQKYVIVKKSIGKEVDGSYTKDDEIIVEKSDKAIIYNGLPQEPELKISYKVGDEVQELEKGKDYFTENAGTDVGDYKLTVRAINESAFEGAFQVEYSIEPYDLKTNLEAEKVKFENIPDQTYTGKPITVDEAIALYVVKHGEEFEGIGRGTDYEFSYSDNTDAGVATITVTGKGNYTGEVTTTFNILPMNVEYIGMELAVSQESIKYTGVRVEPGFKVTYLENELVQDTDYTIVYSNNVNSTVVSQKPAVATIYGTGNYTGSKIYEFGINQADMSDGAQVTIEDIPNQFDVGAFIRPRPVVKMTQNPSVILVPGKDFKYAWGQPDSRKYNVSEGKGVVGITPIEGSNFTASAETEISKVPGQEKFFDIVLSNAEKAYDIEITALDDYGLAGGIIYVNVDRELKEGAHVLNGTRIFKIRSINQDGTTSDDPVFARIESGDTKYEGALENLDATKGGEALLSITGKEVGTTQILLQTKGGTSKRVNLVVNDPAIEIGLDLKDPITDQVIASNVGGGTQTSIYENHDYYLIANLREGQTDKVKWSVNKPEIATINDEGKLTTKKPGSVIVTCTTQPSEVHPGGVVEKAVFDVSENNLAQEVTIDQTQLVLNYKDTFVLNGTATRKLGNVTEVLEWVSSNENVVRVIDGKNTGRATIEAVGPGEATITYGSKLSAGEKKTCNVKVIVPITEVKLSRNEETVKQNGTVQLTATFNENAQDEFVWTSSNEAGVKIVAGTSANKANTQTITLQGIKNGEDATITVTSKSNPSVTASCKVSVVGIQTSVQPGTVTPPKTIKDEKGGSWAVASTVKQDHLKTNLKVADKSSGGKYKILKVTKKNGKVVGGTVAYMAPYNKNTTKMTAPNKVKIGGVAFSVTSIASNAFKGCTKLKSATIGTNVTSIGNGAFSGCTSLKTVTIKSTKLTKIGSKAFYGDTKLAKVIIKSAKMNSVGANAFKKTPQNIKVKVPAAKVTNYTKLLRKGGISKTAKITK